jgi:hypothetical protein
MSSSALHSGPPPGKPYRPIGVRGVGRSQGIQYYSYGVIKAQIFQLTRRAERERYLHLIAFIAHQYYRLHDNLVDVLLSSLQSFHNSALREHKDQCYVRREHRNESLKMLGTRS